MVSIFCGAIIEKDFLHIGHVSFPASCHFKIHWWQKKWLQLIGLYGLIIGDKQIPHPSEKSTLLFEFRIKSLEKGFSGKIGEFGRLFRNPTKK